LRRSGSNDARATVDVVSPDGGVASFFREGSA
jgi:hypothetical protein